MDTSDAWIQERTGIKERHYAKRYEESSTTLAYNAAKIAIERAGITAKDIDFIVFATITPRLLFPWLRRFIATHVRHERNPRA